ncbi:hypothetical protein GCM10010335_02690 [Streptomyces galbus]|nr:hypothetical protein GCM10010335_02690 [Streptomyces galbus]
MTSRTVLSDSSTAHLQGRNSEQRSGAGDGRTRGVRIPEKPIPGPFHGFPAGGVRITEAAVARLIRPCLQSFSFAQLPTKEHHMMKHASILRPRLDKVKPQSR